MQLDPSAPFKKGLAEFSPFEATVYTQVIKSS
jgi:hypothetical protein